MASLGCLTPDRALAYVAGQLPPGARGEAHEHIDRCELCRQWVANLALDSVTAFAAGEPAEARPHGIELGRYRIRDLLGMGGMGMVYRAFDPVLDRDVALKLVAETSPAARDRLLAEARASARIAHPNVIATHDADIVGDEVYVAMELIDGVTLAWWLLDGPSVDEIMDVFAQAGAGLQAAHDAGLVHRDFKPANVLIGRDRRVRVGDFGLATAMPSAAPTAHDRTPAFVGTPAYMAPEQHTGGHVDERADQFAYAVALYEALGGVPPFPGDSAGQIERAIRSGQLAPPRRPIDRRVLPIIRRALDADPARRWPSMRALLLALTPPPPTQFRRSAALPARSPGLPLVVATAFAGVGTLIAIAFALSHGNGAPPRARLAAAPRHTDLSAPRIDRIARITDDIGCEENPSFTADSTSILFDAPIRGDFEIQALDLASGVRRRLTENEGWDLAARASPDGTRFAHVHALDSQRQLWVSPMIPGTATPIPLGTFRGRPSWLDANTLIAGTDEGMLQLIDVASGEHRPFVAGRHGLLDALAPIAGGEWAYQVREGTTARLVVGGTLAPVDKWRPVVGGALASSADGSGLYFLATGPGDALALVRRDVATGVEVPLATPTPGHGLDVARDGTRLVFSSCATRSQIARIRPGTGTPEPLWPGRIWNESRPVALPGGQLAIMSARHARTEIWRVDIATGEGRAISIHDGRQPAVSADGRWLAYASVLPGSEGIHVVELATGTARRLTEDADDRWPGFLSDGRTIAFVRGIGTSGGIYQIGVDGGSPVTPVVANLWALRIATSPVAPRIGVVIADDSRFRIAVVEPGGSLTDVALPPDVYTSIAFSPDGERLLLVRRYRDVVEIALTPGARPVTRWSATGWTYGNERIEDAVYALDGTIVVTHGWAEGDLFLAEGVFP